LVVALAVVGLAEFKKVVLGAAVAARAGQHLLLGVPVPQDKVTAVVQPAQTLLAVAVAVQALLAVPPQPQSPETVALALPQQSQVHR
jgi:hypothetical protein